MKKLSLLCCLVVVPWVSAPLWASPASSAGEVDDQCSIAKPTTGYAGFVAEEDKLEARAAAIDPRYRVLQRRERALYQELMDKLGEAPVDWTDEAGIAGRIPADAERLLAKHDRIVEQLETTLGSRWLQQQRAEQAEREMATPGTKANTRTFSVHIYRDSSGLDSSWDTTLRNLTTTALGDIRKAYEVQTGNTFDWNIYGVHAYDLTGCSPSIPYSGNGGNTFYVYYRRSETPTNGWATYGGYALIDLWPASCGGQSASPNWVDQTAATHEIGHIFTADHRSKAACNSVWNDWDCGTDSSCGYKSCDWANVCNMEYADSTRWFCPRDRASIACWVNGGGTSCGSAQ